MKYYYTDPLAAAWMAKHFGMKTQGLNAEGEPYTVVSWPNHWNIGDIEFKGKMYIHPDSLHLLELQVNDLIAEQDNAYSTLVADKFSCDDISFHFKQDDMKIIQRNGIPFMWPECEE